MSRHIVASVHEIPPGEHKIVEVAGRSIGVYNIGGDFFAIRNRCPHQGAALCEGSTTGFLECDRPGEALRYVRPGEFVRCPWHGWEFDIKTGASWFDPARCRVKSYEVAVEPARSADRVPERLRAETFPVAVEELHVVVELPG